MRASMFLIAVSVVAASGMSDRSLSAHMTDELSPSERQRISILAATPTSSNPLPSPHTQFPAICVKKGSGAISITAFSPHGRMQ